MIKILLEAKANIEFHTKRGWTPLLLAVKYRSRYVTSLLLEADANINFQDEFEGLGPLHMAVKEGKLQTIKILLEAKANIELQTKLG